MIIKDDVVSESPAGAATETPHVEVPHRSIQQRDIEESKQFALSLGMSPEQVAALFDAPSRPPRPPEQISKYWKTFFVGLTVAIAICGAAVMMHYS
jgi:hypothetical protein